MAWVKHFVKAMKFDRIVVIAGSMLPPSFAAPSSRTSTATRSIPIALKDARFPTDSSVEPHHQLKCGAASAVTEQIKSKSPLDSGWLGIDIEVRARWYAKCIEAIDFHWRGIAASANDQSSSNPLTRDRKLVRTQVDSGRLNGVLASTEAGCLDLRLIAEAWWNIGDRPATNHFTWKRLSISHIVLPPMLAFFISYNFII